MAFAKIRADHAVRCWNTRCVDGSGGCVANAIMEGLSMTNVRLAEAFLQRACGSSGSKCPDGSMSGTS